MAWVDDRVWAHPKFTDLSAQAFRCYVYGLCYSSGFNTRGYLTEGQVATIGAKPSVKRELLEVGLWETRGKLILIHDWDEHNGKRDERRAADRERKRLKRLAERSGSPQDSPQDKSVDSPQDVPVDCPDSGPVTTRAGAGTRAVLTDDRMTGLEDVNLGVTAPRLGKTAPPSFKSPTLKALP